MIIRSLIIFIVIAINPSSSVHYKWADNAGNTYEINIQDSSKPKYTPPLTYSNQNRNNYVRLNLRVPLIQFTTQQQRFQQRYPQQQNLPQRYPQQQSPPQQYPQQQNQQQYVGFHNPQYPQQQTPDIAVSNAEWVCTNQKTNEMIVITSEDIPSKFNGREISYINNTFVPNVSRAPQIWTDNPKTEEEPTTTTTEKPIWTSIIPEPDHVNPSWLVNNKDSQPGLIVIEPTTTPPPPKTTEAPDDDNSDDDDDDDGPIKIDFGK